jgi:hypothetical protein
MANTRIELSSLTTGQKFLEYLTGYFVSKMILLPGIKCMETLRETHLSNADLNERIILKWIWQKQTGIR